RSFGPNGLPACWHPRPAVHRGRPDRGLRARLPGGLGPRGRAPRRDRPDRADRRPGRRTPGVRLGRHRRARPGARARHRHPRGRGLTSRELLATLRSFATLNLVGADIVEVAPAYDHAQITGIAAAHVGYELLSALATRKTARPR